MPHVVDLRAPLWLPGGHAQTIWPALFSRRFDGAAPAFRRERWATPDHDFVDVDWLGDDADAVDVEQRAVGVEEHRLHGGRNTAI